jgi:hypothetical protein
MQKNFFDPDPHKAALVVTYEVVLVSGGTTAPDDVVLKNILTNTRLFFGNVRTAERSRRSS